MAKRKTVAQVIIGFFMSADVTEARQLLDTITTIVDERSPSTSRGTRKARQPRQAAAGTTETEAGAARAPRRRTTAGGPAGAGGTSAHEEDRALPLN